MYDTCPFSFGGGSGPVLNLLKGHQRSIVTLAGQGLYCLARNQYINNSPGIFPVFARVRIQARHVFAPSKFPYEFGKEFGK